MELRPSPWEWSRGGRCDLWRGQLLQIDVEPEEEQRV